MKIENSETVPAVRNKAPCYYATLLKQKKVFTQEKSSTPTGLVWPIARKKDLISIYRGALVTGFVSSVRSTLSN